MDRLFKVGRPDEIPLGEGRKFRCQEEEIGIFNLGNEFLAVSNRCPHQGGPLSDGIVAGLEVICPMHGRKVNLKTGCVANEKEKIKQYEVVLKEGEIFLKC
ncbi:MAG: Rieske 2Fe-2S domain-containing protein [Nitrospirae bacterium]|nr:Rieske 2Fe-2S domain-containing protein [Nitrospirota bacterium]MBI3594392.1 Rieske 2Fe-2S domain-containing protein [Nitrospirota bacterium]